MDNNHSSDFFQTDCGSIVSQIEDEEKRIRLKRRWLLGLGTPESENHIPGKSEFLESEFLPESLLREDDIFYETVKSRVEEAFGFRKNEEVRNPVQQKEPKFLRSTMRKLDVCLDSLTNNGLYRVAEAVTGGGSSSFEKTRRKMKEVIRGYIRRDFRERNGDIGMADIVKQVHQVLSDHGSFRKNCTVDSAVLMFPSQRDAARKVLDELDNLPTETLLAMNRKLEGSRTVPRLKCGRPEKRIHRNRLINQVRQASEKMLSELSAGDKLQEQLAKAMSLVDLSLKVSPGYKEITASTVFFQFSPERKSLQNEIVKAVWLLRKKARIDELERLHLILDPEAQIPIKSLKSAVEKMLIEYLFECSDMDVIPESLRKALTLVNRSTRNVDHKVFPGKAIEKETECILNVSAHLKEIFWQCLPDYELDQDFGDAYMEELEDSDDDDDGENHSLFDAIDSSDPVHEEGGAECYTTNQQQHISSSVSVRDLTESITRVHPTSLYLTPTSNKSTLIIDIGTSKTEVERNIEIEKDNQFSCPSLFSVENIETDDHRQQKPLKRSKNQYLTVQEICDETSLVAHNLIGRLLEKFADQEGLDLEADERSYLGGESRFQEDTEMSEEKRASSRKQSDESITVSVVKELMPSLEKSVLMKLKELMELQRDGEL